MRTSIKKIFQAFLKPWVLLSMAGALMQCQPSEQVNRFPDREIFLQPPAEFRAHAALGMHLARIDEEGARAQIRNYYENGFGGVLIVAHHGNAGDLPEAYVEQGQAFMQLGNEGIVYLDADFIRVYRAYLDEAEKHGMRAILYDDYHFPTGQVAGQFYQQFPEHMAARLDKVETDLQGPGTASLVVPGGTFLGASLLNMNNHETKDVSHLINNGQVSCQISDGHWKLMAFYLDHEAVLKIRNPGIVNYIEKEAVKKFLSISYEKFYKGFGEYFGNVIPMSFYDEPSLHWLDGRIWSASLNDLYEERYGESPIRYYPALWYDIGDQTAAVRNAILGLRAEMYADNFVRQLADWCKEHGIMLSGHMDQEERPNPVMANGDLMKVFEYQDIPGADDVFYWGRMNPGYKIVTSASYNYDKPVTWAETYAAYQALDKDIAYKVAMDQYAMGINMQIPAPGGLKECMSVGEFKQFNGYIGRLSYMLQGGRHVSDVAVLYPIASAQAYNTFGEGWEYAYTGGVMPKEFDYLEVGEDLFRRLRIDFTYLHPDVLDKKCLVQDHHLILDNEINREAYQVLIIPGGNTIHTSSAEKILEFFRKGGKVIATSKLPLYSAEFGKDEVVRSAIMEVFGIGLEALIESNLRITEPCIENSNEAGGMAFFVPESDAGMLGKVLKQCLPVRDVQFAEPGWNIGEITLYKMGLTLDSKEWMDMQQPNYPGALTYTHKVKQGRDVYFFANSSENPVETEVILRGKMKLTLWDPLDGQKVSLNSVTRTIQGIECSVCSLKLPAIGSIFLIAE